MKIENGSFFDQFFETRLPKKASKNILMAIRGDIQVEKLGNFEK